MELGYMSVYDVSQKWKISVRRVQELCKTAKKLKDLFKELADVQIKREVLLEIERLRQI